jgi:hypothetical protein
MKPMILHGTRDEYKVFKLQVFRDHINQEVHSRRDATYWLARTKGEKLPAPNISIWQAHKPTRNEIA